MAELDRVAAEFADLGRQAEEKLAKKSARKYDDKEEDYLTIYAVKDLKLNSFTAMFFESNDTYAERNLAVAVNTPNGNMYNTFPSEFVLCSIAKINKRTGKIRASAEGVDILCLLSDLKGRVSLFNEEEKGGEISE